MRWAIVLRGELRTLVAARLALLRAGTDPVEPMVRRLLSAPKKSLYLAAMEKK